MLDKRRKKPKSLIYGLGLDAKDGHTRMTHGKNFLLLGGSKDTHSLMQEKAIKFNEQLDKRHKTLDEINEKEFGEISEKIGIKPLKPPDKPDPTKKKRDTDKKT